MVGDAVGKIVKHIPYGKVVSYSQIASYIGIPGGARIVGNSLRNMKDMSIPWWRVVNNQGRISLKGNWNVTAGNQRELLRKEGVPVDDNFNLDIVKYRFRPDESLLKEWGLDKEIGLFLYKKYGIGEIAAGS